MRCIGDEIMSNIEDSNPLDAIILVMQKIELFNYIIKKENIPYKVTEIRIPKKSNQLIERLKRDPLYGSDFSFDLKIQGSINEEVGFFVQIKKKD